jgi:hypothetical protein
MPDRPESASASPELGIEAAPREQRVDPGASAIFAITIENRSDEAQLQSVEVDGLPEGWATLDFDQRRSAFPGEQRSASLAVVVPQDAAAASLRFRVLVRAGGGWAAVDCGLDVQGEPAERQPDDSGAIPAPGATLAPAEVSVESGSGDEQHVVLVLRNVGRTETEYTATLDGLPATWFSLPSTLRVAAGETIESDLRIRAPASAGSGVHPFVVRVAVSGTPESVAEATGTLTIVAAPPPEAERAEGDGGMPVGAREGPVEVSASVPPGVTLGPSATLRFGPGQITDQATITIQNRSRLLERFTVVVEGLPDDWYRLPSSEVSLEPGGEWDVALSLTPRPGAAHPAGEYEFRVRVAPQGDPGAFGEAGGVLQVEGVEAFDARVAPLQARGRTETYKVSLRNTGTIPISLWIEGSDPEGMSRMQYPPPPNLEPGEERVLPLKVGMRRNRFIGRAEAYDFALSIAPAGSESAAAKTFNARLVHQPYLTGRMLWYSLLAAFAVIVIGVIIGIGGLPRLRDGFDWTRCRFASCRTIAIGAGASEFQSGRPPSTLRLDSDASAADGRDGTTVAVLIGAQLKAPPQAAASPHSRNGPARELGATAT